MEKVKKYLSIELVVLLVVFLLPFTFTFGRDLEEGINAYQNGLFLFSYMVFGAYSLYMYLTDERASEE
ncbi:MAG: hypothetical protein CME70_03045 [Halobacteriovorax sp.]|nr:hypothetical protein [Halobacteriovorax sp.]|tara:strand:- start:29456 stop:29659 length:204 start_codon:yes stop_codon:yes gene_type:complete